MKICTKCERELDESNFYKQKLGAGGITSACKDCYREVYKDRTITPRRKASIKAWEVSNAGKQARKKPNRYYSQCKISAKSRDLEFDLSYEDFCAIRYQPCKYCGGEVTTTGIDRVDSSRGYTKDNCVACCRDCNLEKNDRSVAYWFAHMQKILEHNGIQTFNFVGKYDLDKRLQACRR